MATFAVLEDNLVVNMILADTLEIAEEVTGKVCVEATDIPTAEIDGTYDPINERFIAIKPFASWELDSNGIWQAPIPMPEEVGGWMWDEETLSLIDAFLLE